MARNPVQIEYDREIDAAYLAFKRIEPGEAAHTYTCVADYIKGMVNLDFDKHGRLIGIEVLKATSALPNSFFADEEI